MSNICCLAEIVYNYTLNCADLLIFDLFLVSAQNVRIKEALNNVIYHCKYFALFSFYICIMKYISVIKMKYILVL